MVDALMVLVSALSRWCRDDRRGSRDARLLPQPGCFQGRGRLKWPVGRSADREAVELDVVEATGLRCLAVQDRPELKGPFARESRMGGHESRMEGLRRISGSDGRLEEELRERAADGL